MITLGLVRLEKKPKKGRRDYWYFQVSEKKYIGNRVRKMYFDCKAKTKIANFINEYVDVGDRFVITKGESTSGFYQSKRNGDYVKYNEIEILLVQLVEIKEYNIEIDKKTIDNNEEDNIEEITDEELFAFQFEEIELPERAIRIETQEDVDNE